MNEDTAVQTMSIVEALWPLAILIPVVLAGAAFVLGSEWFWLWPLRKRPTTGRLGRRNERERWHFQRLNRQPDSISL